ncbi:MAG: anion permease [Deltaproteobacteria bacterium]|nr:anion permease [Deltaproteobacteria bacterium]MBW1932633.1 anion permease [Deltaproteobacteria bacterium]MBW1938746.1 anion permease [Deltaproteobacteria bacterium]MBW1964820.1 anion permease [Deltaproteobacteria bacterium]MBW2079776.1 anion permease [Deltaproteobacteria bacterium]
MSHDVGNDTGGGGILANKILWLIVGASIFVLVGFVLPTPQSVIDIVDKYGFANKLIDWEVATDLPNAARKTMIVLGLIPMAVIYFATEALPIGLTGILMPILAYFLHLLPRKMIGKTFAGDAPMFLLGVLAMGVAVVDVGFHKRLASWLLGWTKGFYVPVFVLCLSMSMIGSFISAHAMCAFMTPVMAAVYFGAVTAKSKGGKIEHDPALAKFLLFTLCFALNVGGIGSPAAGGRNVIMMGFWEEYNVPMDFFTWMKYGFPIVPFLGLMVAVYMLVFFSKNIKTKDLTPGLAAIKEETRKMGSMSYKEYVTAGMLLLILMLWIFGGHGLGLGGPSLLALLIPVVFKTTEWKKILSGISWDAWFMYCGALTLGALLKETGAAMWLAQTFLEILGGVGMDQGFGLWVGLSGLSGLMTNFMSDAGTTALLGPIVIPMGIMTGNPAEPWAVGLGVAFATSFAHFLIVGTPNNAIVYGLGTYPDTGEKMIEPIDFVKYGFGLWLISMAVIWFLGFLVMFNIIGFPPDILEKATAVLQSGAMQ